MLQQFQQLLGLRVLFVRLQMLLQSRLRRFRLRLQLGPGVALRGLPEFRRSGGGHRRYRGQHPTHLLGLKPPPPFRAAYLPS